MKTTKRVLLTGLLALATLVSGCVVHEHGHGPRHGFHPRHHGAHFHGHGCGHEMRGGVWVTVPVVEIR